MIPAPGHSARPRRPVALTSRGTYCWALYHARPGGRFRRLYSDAAELRDADPSCC